MDKNSSLRHTQCGKLNYATLKIYASLMYVDSYNALKKFL